MKTKIVEFEVLIPNLAGTDIAERVKVPVTLEWDEEVKEWLLTPEAHEIIDNTKARLIGLLLPAQFKELRERYGYSQKEMGELFQVGEKSWTRWESGKQRPSRSINLLIRALYEGEVSINYLLKRAGKQPRAEGWQFTAKFLEGVFEGWHSIPTERGKALIEFGRKYAADPVGVEPGSSGQRRELIAWVKILTHTVAGQKSISWKGCAWSGNPRQSAPAHVYPQPRLTSPTEA